jgi:hypothetical protein
MKTFLSVFKVVSIAALAVLAAPAEAGDIKARIPFSFSVNGKTLSPGTYDFSYVIPHGLIVVRGYTNNTAVVFANPAESPEATQPQLVFQQYGDQYVLRQVSLGWGSSHEIPGFWFERELLDSKSRTVTMELVVIPAL